MWFGCEFLKDFVFFNGGSIIHEIHFFGAIHFNGKVFGLWIVGDEFSHHTVGVPLLAVNSVCLCHVCRFYTARLTDFFGFIYLFILQLFELIWFEFLNLTGCVYLCDFAGQEKWGIRYHICGCGRLKILKSNIKGELRLNFLSRSRQAWF